MTVRTYIPPPPDEYPRDIIEEEAPPEGESAYDPSDYTVAEVEEYVTANPDQVEEVLEAEVAGKNRSTLVTWLEEFVPPE